MPQRVNKAAALKGFFVTGTDTGVGKTALAASLALLMIESGIRTAPVKPVQTGVSAGQPGDLEHCLKLCGLQPSPAELRLMNPYRFPLPASPHLAAEQAGARISLSRIVTACQKLCKNYQALVVEGAGGLLVPLTRRTTTLELARRLGLPLIIVARAGLGTLNHTLLTLRAAREAGLEVAAVALNHPERASRGKAEKIIEKDNREIIAALGKVEVWEALPYIEGAGVKVEATRRLAGVLAGRGARERIEREFIS